MRARSNYLGTVLRRLSSRYGYVLHTQLVHSDMTQLFVAVLLSPQNTDAQVNKVTPKLFSKFHTFDDFSKAQLPVLRGYLSSLNFYRTKARNLKGASRLIVEHFGGKVPRTIGEMITLPGVGRKVANVVLNEGYGIDEGIAVDTHCGRVAVRLGLSSHKGKPEKIEKDLLKLIPKREWGNTSNLFIELGRDTCKARNRKCHMCVLRDICPSSQSRAKVSV